MNKKLDKHLIGLTGEYLVAGMMSLKGWVASLTLKNFPSVDIFGLNPDTNKKINIQVKTSRNAKSFHVGLKRSQRNIIEDKITCPFVFVFIHKNEEINYFILSRQQLIQLIEKIDDDYFNRPRLKPLKDYPIAVKLKYLEDYRDKWENLWE